MYQKYKENLYKMFDGSVKPIVELEERFYINLGISKNYEDMGSMSYSREYKLIPYNSDMGDQIEIDSTKLRTYKLEGTTNPIIERKDKIPYVATAFLDNGTKQILTLTRKYPEKTVEPTK